MLDPDHDGEIPIDAYGRELVNSSVTGYICYSVHDNLHMTAVLLEAKMHYHPNALAQVIGYYITVDAVPTC